MRCNYSYQLSKWACHSIDKTATLYVYVDTGYLVDELIHCCPVCANLLEAELKKNGEQYQIVPIQKAGEDSAVSTGRP